MINVTKTPLPPLNRYLRYLRKIWASNWITNHGELSIELEKELERYLKVKNLLALANGTLALQLAFKALDLTGEVITTSFTFPATTNALIWEGLKPVYADIDPETFNIDPRQIEKKITKNTSAILPVHVFGNPCDVESIGKIARKYHLKVIYDSAHAFGVKYKGKSVLNWGDVNTLSFHAAKTFHTAEGGAVITKSKVIYEKIELMRNHGIMSAEEVVIPGTNAKMNELQAAMGICVLKDFEKGIVQRKKIYERYVAAFGNNPNLKLQKLITSKYTYPYFPVCFADQKTRDKVYEILFANEIRARKYFFPPCHELPFIKPTPIDLSVSTKISHTILCLPIYATLSTKDVDRIVKIVLQTISSRR